jgi:hypothetical protein
MEGGRSTGAEDGQRGWAAHTNLQMPHCHDVPLPSYAHAVHGNLIDVRTPLLCMGPHFPGGAVPKSKVALAGSWVRGRADEAAARNVRATARV